MSASVRWGICCAVLLAAGAAVVWQARGGAHDAASEPAAAVIAFPIDEKAHVSSTGALLPPREAPPGALEYRSERYRFALFYPGSFSVKEFDEGGGAMTVTFEHAEAGAGFQVFVVPYGAPQVTPERFALDAPTGVFKEPQTITIDGALGTFFYGAHPTLGETREAWFIHAGYLFEVSAPKAFDVHLGETMRTWQFI